MMLRAASAAVVVLLGMAASGQESSHYRHFVEAEDCAMSGGLREGHNPLSSYVGDRFAFAILKEPGVVTLRTRLPRPVPTGKARVFIRTYCSDGKPGSRTMTVRLGGAEAKRTFPDKTFSSKQNYLPFELDLAEPAQEFEIAVDLREAGRIIMDSILVTNDPADGIEQSRRKRWRLRKRLPDPMHMARPTGDGNLLLNSSFEVSPTNGWRAGYQSGWSVSCTLLDDKEARHGEQSLRVPLLRYKVLPLQRVWQIYAGVSSAPIALRKGESYTASAYVKADGPCKGRIGVNKTWETFEIAEKDAGRWQRVSGTIEAPDASGVFYITFEAEKETTVWLDGVQLERGQLTDYKPGVPVDVGIAYDREGAIFREGGNVGLHWNVRAQAEGVPVTIRYLVHRASGEVVAHETLTLTPTAGKTTRVPLSWGDAGPGAYRVAYRVDLPDGKGYGGQRCFSVIPKSCGVGDGPVGLYASHTRQCFESMVNAGVRWSNTLSPSGHFAEWALAEPERGKMVFHDDDCALAREFGIRLIPTIDTTRTKAPKWALHEKPEGKPEDWVKHPLGYLRVADWERFVEALVAHYKSDVKHWLLMDEPDVGTNRYSPEDYAKIVRGGYRGAKRADPDCIIFAHTGTVRSWHQRVLELAGPEWFDAQYTYVGRFDRERAGEMREEVERLKRPIWTVDFGGVKKLSTHYAAIDPSAPPARDAVTENNRKYMLWAIRSLSWGRAAKWFRYDARYPGPPPGTSYMSLWEHDGSLTPHGVSVAVMNALVSNAKAKGEIALPEGMEGHLFASGDRWLLIAWTTDGTARALELRLPVRAWDVYGAPRSAHNGVVAVATMPTFIEFENEPDLTAVPAPVVGRITSRLLDPEGPGRPYRAEFRYEGELPGKGEWVASGPYLLKRDVAQRVSPRRGETKAVFPLNVWPGMALKNRVVEVGLYLPGRRLTGELKLDLPG